MFKFLFWTTWSVDSPLVLPSSFEELGFCFTYDQGSYAAHGITDEGDGGILLPQIHHLTPAFECLHVIPTSCTQYISFHAGNTAHTLVIYNDRRLISSVDNRLHYDRLFNWSIYLPHFKDRRMSLPRHKCHLYLQNSDLKCGKPLHQPHSFWVNDAGKI